MKTLLRRLLKTVLFLGIVGAVGYYPLVLHSPAADGAAFPLDLAQIRSLATSLPGARPGEIRYEAVGEFQFAEAMVMAGEPWQATPIPVYSYQLVYPDRTIVVDAPMPRELAKPDFMVRMYDDGAYRRVAAAMEKAALIVVTHEHYDHIGGITNHPDPARLLPALRLTLEQISHPDRTFPAKLPALFDEYRPLRYEGMHVLAPGVVLIKSPGHTPGSQMVYVQLADGRELLILGDVAWQGRNIEHVRERPLFMTAMIREDRRAVLAEFAALNRLTREAPEVKQLPGHDGAVLRTLAGSGLLQAGFR